LAFLVVCKMSFNKKYAFSDDHLNLIIRIGFSIGMIQATKEVGELCLFLKDKNIKSVLEIGTHCGGLLHVFRRYLKPDISVSVDLPWNESEYNLGNFRSNNPDVTFIIGDAHDNETKKAVSNICSNYDLIFIDADHSYYGGMNHFNMYGDICRFMAFHDINAWPVGDFYREIKDRYPHQEFLEENLFGIGVIQLN
jgi:hypothetical protein